MAELDATIAGKINEALELYDADKTGLIGKLRWVGVYRSTGISAY